MTNYIEILVDSLPVMVDAEEYHADPESVEEQVRENRKAVRLGEDPAKANEILNQ